MPLVRIDLRKGKSAAYKKAIGDAIYRAMRETFVVPDEDRFMVVTEHDDDGFFYSKTYLNIERTDELALIQLTVTNSRNVDQKKALCSRKAAHYPAHDVSPVMTVITCLIWVTFNRVAKEADGPMADTNFDVLIIGSGPGGYVTAIRAAQLGFKTAIVERDYLGGICLNWGCIPTKALLRSAEIFHYLQHAKNYGLKADNVAYDPKAVVQRSRAVSKRLNDGVGFLMKKNKVSIIWGEASIDAPGKVSVNASNSEAPKGALGAGQYQAKHIIIATGARPRVLPGIEPDKELVWTYFEAMVPDRVPKTLLVIGSGAIGIEFASFYRTLGSEVTVVEVLPQILPVEDHEIQTFARKSFEKQGIKIHTNAKVTKLGKKADSVTTTIEEGGKTQSITVERVISAVGVVGNIENLGLEKLGVKTDRGIVVVDQFNKTNIPGIYAIGDVSGPPMLAHKAEHEGVVCIEAIKGLNPHPMNKLMIPGCTYCSPQVASVGLTEQAAKEKKMDVRVGRFPFVGNGKAIALGEDQGLVKVIFDKKTGQLLGAHMVGAEVTELIQGYVVAMNLETTEEELMHTIFPHPTLSEMMKEAVLDAYGRVLNM
jgi:dihydrolipoamide dehydrogenase